MCNSFSGNVTKTMEHTVPTLKALVLNYVSKNIDVLFIDKLHKIKTYLEENNCEDKTVYYVDNQEFRAEQLYEQESAKNDPGKNAIQALRTFLKSQGLPKIVWRETTQDCKLYVGLEELWTSVRNVEGLNKTEARYLAAKIMLRKLYSRYTADRDILKTYNKYEKTYRREVVHKRASVFRRKIPECTINSIDELQGYDVLEADRWSILRAIPEYRLRRSHLFLILHPHSKILDFSFCPFVLSHSFLNLLLKKTKIVERVNLRKCSIFMSGVAAFNTIIKRCDQLCYLNMYGCTDVSSEHVLASVQEYKVDLKGLSLAYVEKNNIEGSLQFEKFINSQFGRRLLSLDLTGVTLCETELQYIICNCEQLVALNLRDTKLDQQCYCDNHDNSTANFTNTVVTKLKKLDISRSPCRNRVLKMLVHKNPDLECLYAASMYLIGPMCQPLELANLTQLRVLDTSFQGYEYEDFGVYRSDLPESLRVLDISGYCNINMSQLMTTCPVLHTLTINSADINMRLSFQTVSSTDGEPRTISHSIQNLPLLTKLEIEHTEVDLLQLLDSNSPLPLQELKLEGDLLDDNTLKYIVNAKVPSPSGKLVHVFSNLTKLHICNCDNLTGSGMNLANFADMPALRDLSIECCPGVKTGMLRRLQSYLFTSRVSLTCSVNDKR